jgi:hypothetical protein
MTDGYGAVAGWKWDLSGLSMTIGRKRLVLSVAGRAGVREANLSAGVSSSGIVRISNSSVLAGVTMGMVNSGVELCGSVTVMVPAETTRLITSTIGRR